jgi:alpha-tubulin suppressor-like RCC1 family protein
MKPRSWIWAMIVVTVHACGVTEPPPSVVVTLARATLVAIGDTTRATATTSHIGSAPLVWRSTNDAVATVDAAGLVTARANGTATIQAAAAGDTGSAVVSVAQVPARLLFVTQPGDGTGGLPLAPQPIIEVQDAGGTRLQGIGVSVSMAIRTNPGPGTLIGTRSVATDTGIATFTNLAVDRVASGYALEASVPQGASAVSEAFDVALGPVSLESTTVLIDKSSVFVRDTVAVMTTIRDAGGNQFPTGGKNVTFLITGGTSQLTFSPVTDNGNGTYSALLVGAAPGTAVAVRASIDGQVNTASPPLATVFGFTAIVAGGNDIYSPARTEGATCGVLNTQALYCWGAGIFGNLGQGAFAASLAPALVLGGHQWSFVSAGGPVTCGITIAGPTYCWGAGGEGQLGNGQSGNGSLDNRSQPTLVTSTAPFKRVAQASISGACAITTADAALCWGFNTFGRLGDGTTSHRNVPTPVSGNLTFGSAELGTAHGCGVTTGGAAYCWGTENGGVLGSGTTPPDVCDAGIPCALSPVPVSGGLSFVPTSIAVAGNVSCAIEQGTSSAYCWGSGAIGDGSTGSATPKPVTGGLQFSQLDANDGFVCGLTTKGEAYCWGDNDDGQLGSGSQAPASTPLPVQGGLSFVFITTGEGHTCGRTADGAAYCWGGNDSGELGDGTNVRRLTPARVRFFRD